MVIHFIVFLCLLFLLLKISLKRVKVCEGLDMQKNGDVFSQLTKRGVARVTIGGEVG